uniref:Aspartate/glutamate/uridylate kinase domain-containing protein n=1 Tax=Helicotheca tamesis TaxID=374047 RepID=A0A7S2HUP3_9STRA|mmetsp:Transcript_2927/g.3973  ORF Transcript_2927/g.3973 Transcript_2927/m.3973 type:complete len:289 (+) Transcript_2927:220-1086(+)
MRLTSNNCILPLTITLYCLAFFFLPSSSSSLSQTNEKHEHYNEEEMLVIVKIGGSSITIKSQYETLNHTSLEWMTRVLQDSLEDRFLSPEEEERKEEEEEEENGIGHVVKGIQQALSKGIIPILHGDACPYGDARGRNGVGILSGDTLVEAIATHWNEEEEKTRISHVVFVTDIDKVYTSDPKVDADAKPLDVIEIDGESGDIVVNLDKNEENSGGGDDDDDDGVMIDAGESLHDHDVTGGLKTKLGAAASIATKGIPVHIVQCGSKSAERAILGEDDNGGTIVRLLQ